MCDSPLLAWAVVKLLTRNVAWSAYLPNLAWSSHEKGSGSACCAARCCCVTGVSVSLRSGSWYKIIHIYYGQLMLVR